MTAQSSAHAIPNEPALLRENIGGIAVLTFNRPQARNTLSGATLLALRDTLAAIAADRTMRAVVLAAEGPVFSAGHDLKEMTVHRADADGGKAYFRQIMETCSAMMQQVVGLPQPVIA